MSHFVYLPSDIANFFLLEDMTRDLEKRVFSEIVTTESVYIGVHYLEHPEDFWREINLELSREHTNKDTLDRLFRGTDEQFAIEFPSDDMVCNHVAEAFKALRLYLLFGNGGKGRPFVKMKLRTLLRILGYKRRTSDFVKEAQEIMDELGIDTSLRGKEKCTIRDIGLDDMIIFRVRITR